jgi:gluconolactonase
MNSQILLIAVSVFSAVASHSAASIVPPGAVPTRLTPSSVGGNALRFTEGPLYDGAGGVYFTDLGNANLPATDPSRIFRYDIASGVTSVADPASGGANGLYLHSNGQVVAAERERRQVARRTAANVSVVETALVTSFNGTPFNGPNDLVIDAAGGIYFTDPDYNNRGRTEAFYYLNSLGVLTRVRTGLSRPNGVVLSPGGSMLYLAVEGERRILAYNVADDGTLSNERQFATMGTSHSPDGLTIDRAGNLYAAANRQVWAWNPAGQLLFQLPMPVVATATTAEDPTNVEFGGSDGRTLFITAGKSLYSIELNVPSPALGDFNGDGFVTAADYTVWRDTLGSTENLSADGDGNKSIDAADFDVWKDNFGDSLGSGAVAFAYSVPEPNCLMFLAGLILFAVRRSRSRG